MSLSFEQGGQFHQLFAINGHSTFMESTGICTRRQRHAEANFADSETGVDFSLQRANVIQDAPEMPASSVRRPMRRTVLQSQGGSVTQHPDDIVATSYSLAQLDDAKKLGNGELTRIIDPSMEAKNFVQLENCNVQQYYANDGGQKINPQQVDMSAVAGSSFMWPQDSCISSRVLGPDERYISVEGSAFLPTQDLYYKNRPPQMQTSRPAFTNEQAFQGANGGNMGYLRCIDQNMIVRPMELRPYDPSRHPIMIEGEEELLGEENEPEESADPPVEKKPKAKKPKKKKEPKIKRPMNAFMVWAKKNRPQLAKNYPGMTNADISVMLGEKWSQMNLEEKQPYFDEAERIKSQHRKDHPDWTYQPKPKRHRFSTGGKSFYFEVTKNTQGAYVTRHINDAVIQQLPQPGKSPTVKSVPVMHPGNSSIHYINAPMLHDPSGSHGAPFPSGHQPGVYLVPSNMIGPGGVLMAQAPVPTYQPLPPPQRQPLNYTTAAGDGLASSQGRTQ